MVIIMSASLMQIFQRLQFAQRGHYEFVVIPFDLIGTPGIFNKTMNRSFALLIGKCVFIFLDDILVFFATYEQHLLDVEKVFQVLEANEFYTNEHVRPY